MPSSFCFAILALAFAPNSDVAEARPQDGEDGAAQESVGDPATVRTVVVRTPPAPGEPVSSYQLSKDEIERLPAALNDPVRALQNLPAVGRAPAGVGLLLLRGADPSTTAVFVDEHPVPRISHVFGLAGVIPNALVESIEVQPSNYDVAFGNAVGGVVKVNTGLGGEPGVHGDVSLGLLGASGTVQSSIRKTEVGVGIRAGLVGSALWVASRAGFDGPQPGYQDYQAIVRRPLNREDEIYMRVLGAADQLRIGDRGAGDFRSSFNRLDLGFRHLGRRVKLFVSPSIRFDASRIQSVGGETTRQDVVGSFRGEMTVGVARRLRVRLGGDSIVDRYTTAVPLPGAQRFEGRGTFSSVGAYAAADVSLARWTLTPGARVSGFVFGDSRKSAADPRVNVRWDGDRAGFFMSGGVYSQAVVPVDEQTSNVIESRLPYQGGVVEVPITLLRFFNPQVGAPRSGASLRLDRSLHASAGVNVEIQDSLSFGLVPFARFTRLGLEESSSGDGVRERTERALGAEAQIRYAPFARVSTTVGYTLMQATVVDGEDRRPSDFDGRHNLLASLDVRLPRGWSAGLRFRLASGYPYTPVVGSAYSSFGDDLRARSPVFGDVASGRRPWFHQLDFRVDKTWRLPHARIVAFVDVQNVYNFVYPELFVYPVTYTGIAGGLGLPILPSLGLRVVF